MAGLYCYLAALLLSLASEMLLCIRQETVFGCEVPGIRAQRTAAHKGGNPACSSSVRTPGLPGGRRFHRSYFIGFIP